MQKKSKVQLKKKQVSSHINETRGINLMNNPFLLKLDHSVLKNNTKDTDVYQDLSISYTSDFPELHEQDSILSNARHSLIDLRTEAQLYLDSSRKANQRTKDSIISINESIFKNNANNSDQISQLVQEMHNTMIKINGKLEKVDLNEKKREEENRELRQSIVDLREKIEEVRINGKNDLKCSQLCRIF